MKTLIFLPLLLLASCSGSTESESTNLLLGDWEGYQFYSGKVDSLVFKGYNMLDLIFREDSVYRIAYPTNLISAYTYSIENDSIYFLEDGYQTKYKWNVSDTLLTLEQQTKLSKLDKVLYKRRDFDPQVIENILKNQINEHLLQRLQWHFDYSNTKLFGWKDIDTLKYSPVTNIHFITSGKLYNDQLILAERDTFRFVRFQKLGFMADSSYLLQIEKVVDGRKVILSYTADDNNAP